MQALFEKVAKFWTPKVRTKKSTQSLEGEVVEAPVEESEGAGLEGDSEQDPVTEGDGDTIDGTSTPPPRVLNDEYLAWTLGGQLRATLSPGSAWKPETPQEVRELTDQLQGMSLDDIDDRLKSLESLVGKFGVLCYWAPFYV